MLGNDLFNDTVTIGQGQSTIGTRSVTSDTSDVFLLEKKPIDDVTFSAFFSAFLFLKRSR